MRKLLLPCVLLTLMFVLPSCLCSDPPASRSSSSKAVDDDIIKLTAYNVAEQYVTQRLKSPSTAVFPDATEKSNHVTAMGNNSYSINSWVDSQNSFGATKRTKFHLTVTMTGDKAKVSDFQTFD